MSTNRFTYIKKKILEAEFIEYPFKHIYIDDFFNPKDFNDIVNNEQIKLEISRDDKDIFKNLFKNNYKVINFPGCITDYKKYIKLHAKGQSLKSHSACESEGIVLRLSPKIPILIELNKFISSDEFNKAIAQKFNINYEDCNTDNGIQKYLDGYEISPHPDVRRKAATFMVNINPYPESEKSDHHTKYLTFKPEFKYIEEFWEQNLEADRQWFPWEWCETKFIQTKNNSIVIFSPSNNTLHGVKANYNHLITQRTQVYGNLWYKTCKTSYSPQWEQLKTKKLFESNSSKSSISSGLLRRLTGKIKDKLKTLDKNKMNRKF